MTQGGVTTTFGYDDIDQLTSESRSGYSASYTYDANGNRATKTLGGVTENYTYDDADKLDYIQVSGNTTKDYSYDAAGRTTSVAVTGVGTTTLAYDYEGRVTTINYPSTATNTFTYKGLDARVGKVDSGGTSTYLRDGAGVTAPVLSDASAVYTPSISERRSSTTTYYHNGFKNAESQTIANETVSATQTFDAFGLADTSSGTWKGPFAYGGPHGYQSDADSGLKLLGHRYYDASTGRFLTRDPVKDGRNWYSYCDNSPTQWSDPSGHSRWKKPLEILLDIWALLHGEGKPKPPKMPPIEPPGIPVPGGGTGTDPIPITLPDGRPGSITFPKEPPRPGDHIGPPKPGVTPHPIWSWVKYLVEALDPTLVGAAMDLGQSVGPMIQPWVDDNNAGGWDHGGTGSYNQALRDAMYGDD